ncbi:MAG: hypothetical protein HC850_01875 [Rhodomicrobium sp.]|nr:hypothetical protein [Rhodomicrobium sp.]
MRVKDAQVDDLIYKYKNNPVTKEVVAWDDNGNEIKKTINLVWVDEKRYYDADRKEWLTKEVLMVDWGYYHLNPNTTKEFHDIVGQSLRFSAFSQKLGFALQAYKPDASYEQGAVTKDGDQLLYDRAKSGYINNSWNPLASEKGRTPQELALDRLWFAGVHAFSDFDHLPSVELLDVLGAPVSIRSPTGWSPSGRMRSTLELAGSGVRPETLDGRYIDYKWVNISEIPQNDIVAGKFRSSDMNWRGEPWQQALRSADTRRSNNQRNAQWLAIGLGLLTFTGGTIAGVVNNNNTVQNNRLPQELLSRLEYDDKTPEGFRNLDVPPRNLYDDLPVMISDQGRLKGNSDIAASLFGYRRGQGINAGYTGDGTVITDLSRYDPFIATINTRIKNIELQNDNILRQRDAIIQYRNEKGQLNTATLNHLNYLNERLAANGATLGEIIADANKVVGSQIPLNQAIDMSKVNAIQKQIADALPQDYRNNLQK